VNTSPVSCQSSPAFSLPLACAAFRSFSALTAIFDNRSVRRNFCVLVSPPALSERQTATVFVVEIYVIPPRASSGRIAASK
jgi:hypothetical protein